MKFSLGPVMAWLTHTIRFGSEVRAFTWLVTMRL